MVVLVVTLVLPDGNARVGIGNGSFGDSGVGVRGDVLFVCCVVGCWLVLLLMLLVLLLLNYGGAVGGAVDVGAVGQEVARDWGGR